MAATRKSRSGPTIPSGQRKRPLFTVTLSPEAIALIRASAEAAGVTVSAWVEAAVRQAAR